MSYSDVYTVSYNCLDVFKTKREAQNFIQHVIIVVKEQNNNVMLLF